MVVPYFIDGILYRDNLSTQADTYVLSNFRIRLIARTIFELGKLQVLFKIHFVLSLVKRNAKITLGYFKMLLADVIRKREINKFKSSYK